MFLARADIGNILTKRLDDFRQGYRQNVALLGDELMGKTTLLTGFMEGIRDEKTTPIYVDVVPYEFALFVKRVLNSLFYRFLRNAQLISTRESLDLLIKRSRELLPQTTAMAEEMLGRVDRDKPEALFRDLFGILECYSQEAKKNCVVILDEFHHLKKLGVKNICQELGKKIMFHKNTLFVVASSAKNEARDILSNELSLLFGNFETLEIQMLNTAESTALVRERIGDIAISPDLIAFLIHITGGHPFYLKTISDEAAFTCRAQAKGACDKDILSATFERLLFHEWGLFHLKFTTHLALAALGRNKNELIYLLDAIATNKNRLKDLTSALRLQKTEICQKLNRLIEVGILSRNGSFYLINDRLLSFWLKYVHHEKHNSLSPDFSEQMNHFRTNIEAEIERFITCAQQKLAQRLMDLFNLFEGDNILLDRKKFHLTPFKELKIVSFDDSNLKLGIFGKSNDSLWLAAVKDDGISEQDVHAFLGLAQKMKQKTVNKIIVGLGDIERNARLLAKESRVLTWDIHHINNLFDLYGKPRIIR